MLLFRGVVLVCIASIYGNSMVNNILQIVDYLKLIAVIFNVRLQVSLHTFRQCVTFGSSLQHVLVHVVILVKQYKRVKSVLATTESSAFPPHSTKEHVITVIRGGNSKSYSLHI